MPVEVVVTITGSSVEDVQNQISSLHPASEPTPAHPTTPPVETQQPPWATSS